MKKSCLWLYEVYGGLNGKSSERREREKAGNRWGTDGPGIVQYHLNLGQLP